MLTNKWFRDVYCSSRYFHKAVDTMNDSKMHTAQLLLPRFAVCNLSSWALHSAKLGISFCYPDMAISQGKALFIKFHKYRTLHPVTQIHRQKQNLIYTSTHCWMVATACSWKWTHNSWRSRTWAEEVNHLVINFSASLDIQFSQQSTHDRAYHSPCDLSPFASLVTLLMTFQHVNTTTRSLPMMFCFFPSREAILLFKKRKESVIKNWLQYTL